MLKKIIKMNPPKELYIDFTNNCNYRCIFCNNRKLEKREFLLLKDMNNLKDLLHKAETIDITGWGEVMTHPEFDDIIKMLIKANKPYVITTNGSLLTPEKIDLFINSPLKHINISLNSIIPEIHAKLSGIKTNHKKIMDYIEILNKSSDYFELTISFVITNHNFKEMPDIIDWATNKNYGLTFFDLTPTVKDYIEGIEVKDTKDNRNFLAEIKQKAINQKVSLFCFDFDKRNTVLNKNNNIITDCTWAYEKFFTGWHNNVTTCCWNQDYLGDISNETWNEIWYGKKYTELRDCIKNNDSKHCKDCRRLG